MSGDDKDHLDSMPVTKEGAYDGHHTENVDCYHLLKGRYRVGRNSMEGGTEWKISQVSADKVWR